MSTSILDRTIYKGQLDERDVVLAREANQTLRRHVRVHHVDRDKDDPMLREVLAQRAEGTGKTRRRRTMTGSSSSGAPIVEFREGSTSAYDQSIG